MKIKGGKLFLTIGLIFLLVNVVSAINTEIKIKTMPGYEVELAIGEASGEGNFWRFFQEISDEYGDAVFTVSTNEPEFDLITTIKKDEVKLAHPSFENPYRLEDNPSGESIYLELAPSWFTLLKSPTDETTVSENTTLEINETETIINESENAEENLTDETNDEQSVTGLFTSEEKEKSSGGLFYYGMGIVGLLMISVIAFVVVQRVKLSRRRRGLDHLDRLLDDMSPKKNKRDLMDDVKKKMKEIEDDIEGMKE